jgi:hypothetical protein
MAKSGGTKGFVGGTVSPKPPPMPPIQPKPTSK